MSEIGRDDIDKMLAEKDKAEADRLKLIHNERIKLFAAATDRISTGCFVVGSLAPSAKLIFDGDKIPPSFDFILVFLLGQATFLIVGGVLFFKAQSILKRLR